MDVWMDEWKVNVEKRKKKNMYMTDSDFLVDYFVFCHDIPLKGIHLFTILTAGVSSENSATQFRSDNFFSNNFQ